MATISSSGIWRVPLMYGQFGGRTWSSMNRPATPAFSNSRTVRMVLIALPYPPSASAMSGMEMAEAML